MAASMCDVFSFCVGVSGRAPVAVEVRFVSSAKVRRRQIRREHPPCSALERAPRDPGPEPGSSSAVPTLRLGSSSRPAGSPSFPARRLPGRSRGESGHRSLCARPLPTGPSAPAGVLPLLLQAGPGGRLASSARLGYLAAGPWGWWAETR